jgi:membrane protein
MTKFNGGIAKLYRFLTHELWYLDRRNLSKIQSIWVLVLQVVSLTIQKFVRDNCALRASALTFYSLLSVVPVMALGFAISKGFGFEQRLENWLYQRLAGQEEILAKIIVFSRSLLENAKGGLIAGIGVAILFWSAIKLLGHIEKALNDIWRVPPRSHIRRFTDYLAIMIVSPLLVITSSSVTVYVTTQITAITGRLALLKAASPLIFLMLKLLPFGLIWLLFIMVYLVMPNTRVRVVSCILGGVIAGTAFQFFQGIYISAQVVVAKYNAVYGSFAALPLFLIWLQISWLIMLFGAQIVYAHQHCGHGLLAEEIGKASNFARKIYALRILKLVIAQFEEGTQPPTAKSIAEQLNLPLIIVTQLIAWLKSATLVSEVADDQSNGPAYQPARDIQLLTVSLFLKAWEQLGQDPVLNSDDGVWKRIQATMESVDSAIEQSEANRLIRDL